MNHFFSNIIYNIRANHRKRYLALFESVKQGDCAELARLLNANYSVHTRDINENSLIIIAVQFGQLSAVELLIERGANVNDKGRNGRSCLYMATLQNYVEIAQKLIDSGADVNLLDDDRNSALFCAALYGRLPIVKLLLSSGAYPSLCNKRDESALMKACFNGHRRVWPALLRGGAHIDVLLNIGSISDIKVSLVMALLHKNKEAAAFDLIELGAKVNHEEQEIAYKSVIHFICGQFPPSQAMRLIWKCFLMGSDFEFPRDNYKQYEQFTKMCEEIFARRKNLRLCSHQDMFYDDYLI